MNLAIEDLNELQTELQEDFTLFFKDLVVFSNQKLKGLPVISNEVKRN